MHRRFAAFAALLILAACAKGPSMQLGQTLEGALDSADVVSADGPYEDRWTFDLTAGQRIRIEMRAEGFDSYLKLLGPDASVLSTNDDALGRDAAITIRVPTLGRYTAVATSYGREKALGSYRISLIDVPGEFAAPGAIGTIAVGAAQGGVLEVGDSTTTNNGYADYFDFSPTATGSVVFDLMSTQFDGYLILRDSLGIQLATDDDSGENRNAQLTTPVVAGARYRLVATTYGSGARSGTYQLAIRTATP